MATRFDNIADYGALLKGATKLRKPRPKRLIVDRHIQLIQLCCCCVCGQESRPDLYLQGTEAAHVRYSDASHGYVNPGMGARPGDYRVVPLGGPFACAHHKAQHDCPKGERGWWEDRGLDPYEISESLWHVTGDWVAMNDLAYAYAMTSKWERTNL